MKQPVVKTVVKPVTVPVVKPSEDHEAVVKPVLDSSFKAAGKYGDKAPQDIEVGSSNKRKKIFVPAGSLAKRTRNALLNKKE